jgi:arylsulfatase A-like enzyme
VQPPHDPYTPPADFGRHNAALLQLRANVPPIAEVEAQARVELAGYYGLIENLDYNLGRIRQHLHTLGMTENTYVIYLSDHGDQHGSHGHFRKMTPYAESIDIPFIIGGPCTNHYRLPHTVDAPLNHVDVAPTTLGLCGIKPPDDMAGFDYSGVMTRGRREDSSRWPNAALLQCVVPPMHGPSVDRPWRGILRRDGWKYVTFEGAPYLMFDTKADPLELRNLAHHTWCSAQRSALQAQLRAMLADVGDHLVVPD